METGGPETKLVAEWWVTWEGVSTAEGKAPKASLLSPRGRASPGPILSCLVVNVNPLLTLKRPQGPPSSPPLWRKKLGFAPGLVALGGPVRTGTQSCVLCDPESCIFKLMVPSLSGIFQEHVGTSGDCWCTWQSACDRRPSHPH